MIDVTGVDLVAFAKNAAGLRRSYQHGGNGAGSRPAEWATCRDGSPAPAFEHLTQERNRMASSKRFDDGGRAYRYADAMLLARKAVQP
jgi:hypothetical protein